MISILTTGGTIACTMDADGALVPTVSGTELAQAAGLDNVRVTDLIRLDSSSLTLADLEHLLRTVRRELEDERVDGVVITHGTDSLEETALALSLTHTGAKPVVLTGAQRSFDHPESDGPDNLRAAVAAARSGAGVHVAFGGRVLPAWGLRKVHTSRLDAFDNTARGTGPTGYTPTRIDLAEVPIVAAYPGAPAWLLDTVADSGVDGIVIEALGSGNMSSGFGEAAARALRESVPVVVATRVPHGEVTLAYGGQGGGATLADLGALSAGELSAGQARIALIVAQAAGVSPVELFPRP